MRFNKDCVVTPKDRKFDYFQYISEYLQLRDKDI